MISANPQVFLNLYMFTRACIIVFIHEAPSGKIICGNCYRKNIRIEVYV
jgi:hypothetical protein